MGERTDSNQTFYVIEMKGLDLDLVGNGLACPLVNLRTHLRT